jgi:hypothetical protein
MRHLTIATILAATSAFSADFSTKPALDAAATYAREVAAADEAHAKALAAAQLKYSKALESAQLNYGKALDSAAKRAATDGNLDEVSRIAEEKARIAEDKVAIDASADERGLWRRDTGTSLFQRLADGSWVELSLGEASSSVVHHYVETARTREFVEISTGGFVVRLRDDSTECYLDQVLREQWCYRGSWDAAE